MADYLDRLRMNRMYSGLKEEIAKVLGKVPLLGDPAERFLAQLKEAAKAGLHGGMLFEDLGLRYFGPIDGHNIGLIRKYLRMVKNTDGPILLHVVTHGGYHRGNVGQVLKSISVAPPRDLYTKFLHQSEPARRAA